MTPRYVLVGLAAELSLRPLARALELRGAAVRVVDLAIEAADASVVPAGDGPLVLVSSQHLALTGEAYNSHVGLSTAYVAPQVLRARLGAELLVYVPHDLAEPVLASEVELLRTVDLYAAPDADRWWARAHAPTVVTGWVGSAWWDEEVLAAAPLARGVLFLTQVQWLMHQGGAPFVLRTLERTLASGLAVKLPVWPGLGSLSAALEAHGVTVLDPRLPAAGIARVTPLVVANAPSSVLAEASEAGHRPVCVLPAEGGPEFAGQLGALDVVVCSDAEFPRAVTEAGLVRPPGARFDVDAFVGAVEHQLRERGW